MKIALLQANLFWEDKAANLAYFDAEIQKITQKVDIIVLPEMFTTAFTMNAAAFAENTSENDGKNSETLTFLRKWATQFDALLIASCIVTENNHFYNRLLAVKPDNTFQKYDKRHLFGMGAEDKTYTAGSEKLVLDWRGWRIMPLVCYDLRFPTWSRNTTDYDILIYIANWPERRAQHWKTLLRARAIENQAYTIGVNRIGFDAAGLWHSGDSAVIDPIGDTIFEIKNGAATHISNLEKTHLQEIRTRLPFLKDRD
jgi:predicted amidohydrolase